MQRGEATIDDAPLGIATGTWQPLECPPKGAVDGPSTGAPTGSACSIGSAAPLGRREVFVPAADRSGDPRRLLTAAEVWKAARPAVLPSLDLGGGAGSYIDALGHELNDAYHRAAEIVEAYPEPLIDDDMTVRQRLKLRRLERVLVAEQPVASDDCRDQHAGDRRLPAREAFVRWTARDTCNLKQSTR